jgi:FtsH-binding integral membrane protein
MSNFDRNAAPWSRGYTRTGADVDQGLRAFMLGVYNNMTIGLALTGLVALGANLLAVSALPTPYQLGSHIYLTSFGAAIYSSPLRWVIMFAPLAFVLFFSLKINTMAASTARTLFFAFAAVMGLSLSSILLIYTGSSIARAFFITSATFGALSLYGYTTKKDLSAMGSFLIMGVIGIVIASLVNLFLQSGALQFAISVIGVLVFAGLTAYDTQRIKDGYYEVMGDATAASKAAIMGALNLYLDFINMFVMLLQLFGNRE